MKPMNLPNKLTIIRFVLAPVFLVLMLVEFNHHLLLAFIVFFAAAITDILDGSIARKRSIVTNFGKFLDPIADKMLTSSAFLAFTFLGYGYGIVWITFIVLAREFIIASVRLLAADNGKVVAANSLGKLKTVMQMTAVGFTIAFEYFIAQFAFIPENWFMPMRITYSALLWIAALLTLASGVKYVADNIGFMKADK